MGRAGAATAASQRRVGGSSRLLEDVDLQAGRRGGAGKESVLGHQLARRWSEDSKKEQRRT